MFRLQIYILFTKLSTALYQKISGRYDIEPHFVIIVAMIIKYLEAVRVCIDITSMQYNRGVISYYDG